MCAYMYIYIYIYYTYTRIHVHMIYMHMYMYTCIYTYTRNATGDGRLRVGPLRQPGALPGAARDSEMPRSGFSVPASGPEHAFEGCRVPGSGLS